MNLTYTLGECCSPSVRPAFRRRCRIPGEKIASWKSVRGFCIQFRLCSSEVKEDVFLKFILYVFNILYLDPTHFPIPSHLSSTPVPPPNIFKREKELFLKREKKFKISSWKLQCDTLFISDVDLGPLCTCAHMNKGNRESVGRRGYRKDE